MVVRNTASFPVSDKIVFKQQMLSWANRFNICCFLDTAGDCGSGHEYDCLLAAGANEVFSPQSDILPSLRSYYSGHHDWLFGHISYELNCEIAGIDSRGRNDVGFPVVYLFCPQIVVSVACGSVCISTVSEAPEDVFKEISATLVLPAGGVERQIVTEPRTTKEEYLSTVEKLRKHIAKGDCYEINYCIEFFSRDVYIDPPGTYRRLADVSPNPFGCYYKCEDRYLLCASPERYIKKEGGRIISQPIKGTIGRSPDQCIDVANREKLRTSSKDRSENIMIVDLVRNDLSRVCRKGSVSVEELFGIYSFPQVHQMISTIGGELEPGVDLPDILKATFPMGSMTGAPKQRVMELIRQYENSPRGIFSGTVGYVTPEGDFDFNVVIRSIMYNASRRYLNYRVGSGITFYSDPENEYEECLLKAAAIEQVLA